MSTELKLTLNAEAYYAELEKVIQTAKQSSARIKDSADVRSGDLLFFTAWKKNCIFILSQSFLCKDLLVMERQIQRTVSECPVQLLRLRLMPS